MILAPFKSEATPLGFGLFCLSNPNTIDCTRRSGRVGSLEEIAQVKTQVDRSFRARNDFRDDWDLLNAENRHGDCEDFALTYRNWLLNNGWPSSALRLATGLRNGEGHAVLIVSLNGANMVLDILLSRPVPLETYRMTWWEIQSTSDPVHWD